MAKAKSEPTTKKPKRTRIKGGDLHKGDKYCTDHSSTLYEVLEEPEVCLDGDNRPALGGKDGDVPKMRLVVSPPAHGQTVHCMASDEFTKIG